jgi:predicted RecB family nuclease
MFVLVNERAMPISPSAHFEDRQPNWGGAMSSPITSDVLESYLLCRYKAHLKLANQHGTTTDYESMLVESRQDVRRRAIDVILTQHPADRIERGIALTAASLKRGAAFILDAVFEDDGHLLRLDGLKRIAKPSSLGSFHYIPVLFHESRNVRKEQKILLAFYGTVLAGLQGKPPDFGIVWHGRECRASKVSLKDHRRAAEQLLDSLREMREGGSAPPLILNDHCQVCEFRQRCHSQAVADNNLSLLRGIGPKEIKGYARKGIFTVGQLSHTFRPRRKGKRAEPGSQKRHVSLQAMAIRDKTIYVFGLPQVRTSPVKVYFDIEADPEEAFVYLIGMIVVDGTAERRFSFWADQKQDERALFEQFLAVVSKFDDLVLYSYGSYETAFLKRMQKDPDLKPQVDRVLAASVNILSVIYAHIYFPTYSNGLKDIGTCLGCTWTEPNASGLQSMFWRAKWDSTQDEAWKQKLIQYNLEDCVALKVVTDQACALVAEPGSMAGRFRVATVQDFDQQARIRKWGTVNFVHSDYAYINNCAYFNYQRQRVYVKTSKTLRRKWIPPAGHRLSRLRVTRRVEVVSSECESCKSTDVVTQKSVFGHRGPKSKRAFDLVRSSNGVKLSVIYCRTKIHECRTCGAIFVPHSYRRLARYFHGVKSWAMYLHITHGLSFGTIREMM